MGEEKISCCGARKMSKATRTLDECIVVPVNGSKEVLCGSGSRGSRGYHVLFGRPVC